MTTSPTASQQNIYSARPTLRVDTKFNARVSALLLSAEVREQEGGLSQCELVLSNIATGEDGDAQSGFEDENELSLGTRLGVYMGDERSPLSIFNGVVTAIEARYSTARSPQVVIYAEDLLQRARMTRRTKVYKNFKLSTFIEDMASELGLKVAFDGLSDDLGVQVQLGESDLAFVRRMLRRVDGDLQVVDDAIHVALRDEIKREEIELRYYSQLREVSVMADLAHQVSSITVSGWDADEGKPFKAKSMGSALSPGSGRLGATVLEDVFGTRDEHIDGAPATNVDEAQALADALYDQRARRFVRLCATSNGIPEIQVGAHVRVVELSPRFDNVYHVVSTCHRYDPVRGYEVEFEAESAFLEFA